jgi:type I restriction enzyme S subunit
MRRGIPRAGDVVLTTEAPLGEVAQLGNVRVALAQRVVTLRGKAGLLDNTFLRYLLQTDEVQSQLAARATGTTVLGIKQSELRKVEISLPPIDLQRSSASLLASLDDRIALLHETNATLEAIAQALFKSWFVDFDPVRDKSQGLAPAGMDEATAALFPDRLADSDVGPIPEGWAQVDIGRIAEVIDCLHSKKPELLASGKPFLQLSNIRDDGLLDTSKLAYVSDADYAKWVSRIEVTGGDCVITNVGRVGAVSQIPAGYKAAMGRNMTAVRLRADWPYSTYLIQLLLSDFMRSEIRSKTDVGTILDALNVRSIPRLRCVVGSHGVMRAFESACRPIQVSMELNLDRANALAEARDTLLPRLISGQLRLPETEALPA